MHLLALLLLVTAAGLQIEAQTSPNWISLPPMSIARYGHTSILLNDGKVLIAGGKSSCLMGSCITLNSAEIYDPGTREWVSAGDMINARSNHFAVRLTDGTVLVGGGAPPVKETELYSQATGLWAATGSMNYPRSNATATLLRNGMVLVTGGADPCCSPLSGVSSAELYDPDTGEWTLTAPMLTTRTMHTATLLADGRVLIVGGGDWGDRVANLRWSAEIYYPDSGIWTNTDHLRIPRAFHSANLLPDGRVLVTGGGNLTLSSFADIAEIYDPATGEWNDAGETHIACAFHTATSLQDGRVMVAGGFGSSAGNPALQSVHLYDPAAGAWTPGQDMMSARGHHAATMLANGTFMLTGGSDEITQGDWHSQGMAIVEMLEEAAPTPTRARQTLTFDEMTPAAVPPDVKCCGAS
jgi:N-acetylneuraminic acid mutarotase